MTTTHERCQGKVWHPSGQVRGWGTHRPCPKRATRDGWCGTHHPEAVAKREERVKAQREEAARRERAKWDRESRLRAIGYAIDNLTPDEVAALPASIREILSR